MCFGLPGRLIEAADADGLALVDVGGLARPINMTLLGEDQPAAGEWVLVHAGIALSRLAEADALAALREMGAAEHGDPLGDPAG